MLSKRFVERADLRPLIDTMARWTPAAAPVDPLHPGDLGWFLRFDDDAVVAGVVRWDLDSSLVAVGLLDDASVRLALAPSIRDSEAMAALLFASIASLLPADGTVEVSESTALRAELERRGWFEDNVARPRFVRSLAVVPPFPASAEIVTAATATERVEVQRGSFDNSTFSVPRWRAMTGPPAGDLAIDVLVRDADGHPAAAATAWFAGRGRCGLLEPVGTHKAYQGRGHGRSAVLAACAALAERGASAVAVTPPSSNTPALRLYASAGFDIVGADVALRRTAAHSP